MGVNPPVETVYKRPETFTDATTHYCPGCTHGVAHRLIAEVLEEMNLQEKTIGIASVGCSLIIISIAILSKRRTVALRLWQLVSSGCCPTG